MILRAHRRTLCFAFALALASPGCDEGREIPITLDFDGEDWSGTASFVLAVYDDDECDFALEGFPFPIYTIDTHDVFLVDIQFFAGDHGEPVGDLDEGTYAFVGMALDDVCMIDFIGCTVAEMSEVDEIVVPMEATGEHVMPFCGDILSGCINGRCVGH